MSDRLPQLNLVAYYFLMNMLFVAAARRMLKFEVFPFLLHLLDEVLAVYHLQMPHPPVFIAVLGTVFRVNILARINFHVKMLIASFKRAIHHHGHHFRIIVLEGLIFYIDVLGFGPFPDTIPVLAVFRTVFRNVDTEEYLSAPRIKTPFFPEFLAPS
jgi:hypothetical protein